MISNAVLDRLRRRAVVASTVLGIAGGAMTGVAYGAFSHTYNYWIHGMDGDHVWLTRDHNLSDYATAAAVVNNFCAPSQSHPENSYTSNHIHITGGDGLCTETVAGHFSSPSPYLGHHSHTENG